MGWEAQQTELWPGTSEAPDLSEEGTLGMSLGVHL